MNGRKKIIVGLITVSIFGLMICESVNAETRSVTILQDTGADRMITKVYKLKHTLAADIVSFVAGAVITNDSTSSAKSLNYSVGDSQMLIVTMRHDRVAQIDDLIQKLDHPGLNGTGIHDFCYSFKFRDAVGEGGNKGEVDGGLTNLIEKIFATGDSNYMIDETCVYFKDSKSDGTSYMNVLKKLDLPIPQVEVTIKHYQIFEDDMLDIGVNYNQWQNLYKGEWFNFSWSHTGHFTGGSAATYGTSHNSDFFGDFDFYLNSSFLRLANTLNKEVKMTKSSIVVRNNMSKGSDGLNVAKMNFGNLQINFKSVDVYVPGHVFRTYVEIIGRNGVEKEYFYTRCKIKTNEEITLLQFSDEVESEVTVGIPFLMDIPVVKYLFSREMSSKRKVFNFITIKATPIQLDTNETEFAKSTISQTKF